MAVCERGTFGHGLEHDLLHNLLLADTVLLGLPASAPHMRCARLCMGTARVGGGRGRVGVGRRCWQSIQPSNSEACTGAAICLSTSGVRTYAGHTMLMVKSTSPVSRAMTLEKPGCVSSWAGSGMGVQGRARQGRARQGRGGQGQGKAVQCKTVQGKASQGRAGQGIPMMPCLAAMYALLYRPDQRVDGPSVDDAAKVIGTHAGQAGFGQHGRPEEHHIEQLLKTIGWEFLQPRHILNARIVDQHIHRMPERRDSGLDGRDRGHIQCHSLGPAPLGNNGRRDDLCQLQGQHPS